MPEQHSPSQQSPKPASPKPAAFKPAASKTAASPEEFSPEEFSPWQLSPGQLSPGHTMAPEREPELRRAGPGRGGPADLAVLAVIAAGGAAGAAARHLIGVAWPARADGLPVSTLAVNVLGCALIGVLMVLITDVWSSQRLLRPFLGTGVLGGFTTFSTYAVDIQQLLVGAHPGAALLYLGLTPVSALLAVWLTATATRRLVSRAFA